MPLVAQGAPATISLDVRNGSGSPTDPTGLTLSVNDSFGTPQAGFPVVYPGTIVKDSVGSYHYIWSVPGGQAIDGYTAIWNAVLLGADEEAQEAWQVVAAGSLTPAGLDFLVKPDDYDAIRGLLGVTTLDVEDTDIEFTAFGPQAELLIKRRVSNWATQVTDPTDLFVLRLAAVYQTACLMAESFVRGGTIGLVRPLSVGEGRDWAAAAEGFCSRYEYWVNIADDSDADGEVDSAYDIHPMRVGGPTTRRISRRLARRPADMPYGPYWWMTDIYPPYWTK